MKKVTILAIFLILLSVNHAVASGPEDRHERCKILSEIASLIMKGRQEGVPASKIMGNLPEKKSFQEISEILVIYAYDYPKYQTAEEKEQIINEFSETIYLECIKGLKELE